MTPSFSRGNADRAVPVSQRCVHDIDRSTFRYFLCFSMLCAWFGADLRGAVFSGKFRPLSRQGLLLPVSALCVLFFQAPRSCWRPLAGGTSHVSHVYDKERRDHTCSSRWQSLCCRFIGNRFLKKKVLHHHTSEQSIEWLYAFDVHCNSFLPMFVLIYGAHVLVL